MASRKVEVRGLQQLGENIRALSEELKKGIAPAMTSAAARVVKKSAVSNAPDSEEEHKISGTSIEPGNLKRNIIVVKNRKTNLTAEHLVTVRGKEKGKFASRYGSMIEHGTVKMGPRPFLRPAFDNNVSKLGETMRAAGERRVLAAVRKMKKAVV